MTSPERQPLQSRHCVVFGGTRGLGRALAQELLSRHAKVSIVAGHISYFCADLTDSLSLRTLATNLEQVEPPVSVVFLTAADFYKGSFADLSPDKVTHLVMANFTGPVLFARLILPTLQKNAYADIVNVASISSATNLDTSRSSALHIASKAALHTFGTCLGRELASERIRVTTLAPSALAKNGRPGIPLQDLAELAVNIVDLPPTLRVELLPVVGLK